jgi:hypothetical protein
MQISATDAKAKLTRVSAAPRLAHNTKGQSLMPLRL